MSSERKRALCWIRRDLRLNDHCALAEATHLADEVAVVFVFDTRILDRLEDKDDRRLTFIHRSLQELDRKLRDKGSALIVRHGDPIVEIPSVAAELECDLVVAGRDYEPYAIERDQKVKVQLQKAGVEFRSVKDSVVFEAGEVLSQSGTSFRVYTPYSRAWRARFNLGDDAAAHDVDLEKLMGSRQIGSQKKWSLESIGFIESDLWLEPGEDAALERLGRFRAQIARYGERRDFPAQPGTSTISVDLRFGTLSIRDAVRLAQEDGSPGADKWLGELIWRDFYQDVLAHNPHVVDRAFQPQFEGVEYPGEEAWFEAWKSGMTGYPLIDAAMRCFKATGWMHNRLRMVVASFLTKDLLIDYRKGEAYFARYLLDFDLASNNGGWQWAASTGADAQPYFRIFNPILQSEKFDADGEFIRHWLPEIAVLTGKAIHWPHDATAMELAGANVILGQSYPHPIVVHGEQRIKAIELLGAAKR